MNLTDILLTLFIYSAPVLPCSFWSRNHIDCSLLLFFFYYFLIFFLNTDTQSQFLSTARSISPRIQSSSSPLFRVFKMSGQEVCVFTKNILQGHTTNEQLRPRDRLCQSNMELIWCANMLFADFTLP